MVKELDNPHLTRWSSKPLILLINSGKCSNINKKAWTNWDINWIR